MRFGMFHELQWPRPWNNGDGHRMFRSALEQVALADRGGRETVALLQSQ
jgi:hypothetical protein